MTQVKSPVFPKKSDRLLFFLLSRRGSPCLCLPPPRRTLFPFLILAYRRSFSGIDIVPSCRDHFPGGCILCKGASSFDGDVSDRVFLPSTVIYLRCSIGDVSLIPASPPKEVHRAVSSLSFSALLGLLGAISRRQQSGFRRALRGPLHHPAIYSSGFLFWWKGGPMRSRVAVFVTGLRCYAVVLMPFL